MNSAKIYTKFKSSYRNFGVGAAVGWMRDKVEKIFFTSKFGMF